MSIKLITLVWEYAQATGSDLLVLLAMADYGDDNGRHIFPSMQTLSRKARLSEDQTRRIVNRLIKQELVTLVRQGGWRDGRNWANEYELNLDRILVGYSQSATTPQDAITPPGKLQPQSPRGRDHSPRVDATTVPAPMQPQPLYDPSFQPSGKQGEGEGGEYDADQPLSPSLAIFHEFCTKPINQTQTNAILSAITDLELWRRVLNEWSLRGYNPANVAGLLDWYREGIPSAPKNGSVKHGNRRPTGSAPDEPDEPPKLDPKIVEQYAELKRRKQAAASP